MLKTQAKTKKVPKTPAYSRQQILPYACIADMSFVYSSQYLKMST